MYLDIHNLRFKNIGYGVLYNMLYTIKTHEKHFTH